MDAVVAPAGLALDPGFVSLAALPPGTRGSVPVMLFRASLNTRAPQVLSCS